MTLSTSVRVRRTGIALAIAGAAVVSTAVPAAADQPLITKIPAGPGGFTFTGVCEFDVRLDFMAQQGVLITFLDRDGEPRATHVSGAFTGTVTRLNADGSDGPSIQFNFAGPGTFAIDGSSLTARGLGCSPRRTTRVLPTTSASSCWPKVGRCSASTAHSSRAWTTGAGSPTCALR